MPTIPKISDTESIAGVGKIIDYPSLRKEFISNLMTKSGKSIYTSKQETEFETTLEGR